MPVHDVVFAWTTVVETFCMMHIKDRREIDQLLSYVVKTYIGLINSRTGNSPLFAIEMWNIYDRILNDKHTTNNAVWNVGIKLLVPTTISSEGSLDSSMKIPWHAESFRIWFQPGQQITILAGKIEALVDKNE